MKRLFAAAAVLLLIGDGCATPTDIQEKAVDACIRHEGIPVISENGVSMTACSPPTHLKSITESASGSSDVKEKPPL